MLWLGEVLASGEYRSGPYTYFRIFEPKERLVAAAPFRDRVVLALVRAILASHRDGTRRIYGDSLFECREEQNSTGRISQAPLRRPVGHEIRRRGQPGNATNLLQKGRENALTTRSKMI